MSDYVISMSEESKHVVSKNVVSKNIVSKNVVPTTNEQECDGAQRTWHLGNPSVLYGGDTWTP